VIAALVAFTYYKKHSKIILKTMKTFIRAIIDSKHQSLIIISIFYVYLMLSIPGLSVFVIYLTFEMKSFWKPYLYLMASHFLAASCLYYLVRSCCRVWLVRKYKDAVFFKFVMKESRTRPCLVGMLVRFLSVQPTIKNVLCALGEIRYWTYIVTLYPNSLLYGFVYCYVGVNLAYMDEIKAPKRKFSDLSYKEKLSLIFSYLALFISLCIIIFIICYTKIRLKSFLQEEHK
jgi:uncharacterized membrane protein YdjX (TVP38/TMEM64 family)